MVLARPTSADVVVKSTAMKAPTIAEIFVEREAVRVELEIGNDDLRAFRNLLPDDLHERMGYGREPHRARLRRFFSKDWVVTADGHALRGAVTQIVSRRRVLRDEITGEPLPSSDGAERVVFAELVYSLKGLEDSARPRGRDRPATLSVRPPSKDDSTYSRATIGFVLYHLGLAVNDFRYLSLEESVDLDWQDPWYSRFRNKNLWRQYSTPINAFLYIEHYEVRVEIIVRPFDLKQWTDPGLGEGQTIPVDAQPGLKERAADFLAKHIQLSIDGRSVKPALDRIHFLRRTLRTSTVVDPPEELDVLSATLGAIYVVPRSALPQTASLTWDLFSPKMPRVRAAATDEAGAMPTYLQPDDKVLEWKNFLKKPKVPKLVEIDLPPEPPQIAVPLVSVACAILLLCVGFRTLKPERRRLRAAVLAAVLLSSTVVSWPYARFILPLPFWGPPEIANQDAGAVLSGLLKNVYHAFDYRDESLIYDTLARSISGDLLTRVYLETRKSLELQSQGGARVKVKQVDMVSVDSTPLANAAGFTARSIWQVTGTVGHWGHVHTRANRYDARFTVRAVDDEWKITELELLLEERAG